MLWEALCIFWRVLSVGIVSHMGVLRVTLIIRWLLHT